MSKANFYCNQCDLTLTGSAPYTMHLAGKKHLKKLKTIGVPVPQKGPQGQPDSTVAEPISKKVAEGYGGKFVSGSSSVQGTSPYPTPPGNSNTGNGPYGNYSNYGYGNQYGGSGGGYVTYPNVAYTDAATGQQWINPAPPVTGASENLDPVMKAVRDNLLGKLPKKRSHVMTERCDLCNIDYSSESNKQQHVSGKKHLKKVQLHERTSDGQTTFYCDFCKKELNSPEQMEQHRAGAPHLKKVKARQDSQLLASHPGLSEAKKKYIPGAIQTGNPGPTEVKNPPVTTTTPVGITWHSAPKKQFVPTTTQIAVSSV